MGLQHGFEWGLQCCGSVLRIGGVGYGIGNSKNAAAIDRLPNLVHQRVKK